MAGALPVAAAGAEVQSPVRPGQVRWGPLFELRQVPWGVPGPADIGTCGGAGRRHAGAVGWAGTGVPGPSVGPGQVRWGLSHRDKSAGRVRDCRGFSSDSGATRSRTRRGSVRVVRDKPGPCSAPPCPARGGHRGWAFPAAPPGLGLGIARRTGAGGSRGRAGRGPRPLVPAGSGPVMNRPLAPRASLFLKGFFQLEEFIVVKILGEVVGGGLAVLC